MWLSVKQLGFFHSVMLVYKAIKTTFPRYIYSKLSSEFPYNTRLAESEAVRMGTEFKTKLDLTEKSFMQRATLSYNQLPTSLRQVQKVENFKKQLKTWVQKNITI